MSERDSSRPSRGDSKIVVPAGKPAQDKSVLRAALEALTDEAGYMAGLLKFEDQLRSNEAARYARFFYEEILRRYPESAEVARTPVAHIPDIIVSIMSSEEFIIRHINLFLNEFKHLNREFYIHVPKCGGTTLISALGSSTSFCSLTSGMFLLDNLEEPRMEYLRSRVLDILRPEAENVFLLGHADAAFIIENQLKRGSDNVYALLRHPLEIAHSFINFVLGVLECGPFNALRLKWLQLLDLPQNGDVAVRGQLDTLVPKIIERLLPSNLICAMLSRYASFADALEVSAILDIRFIHLHKLNEFIAYKGLAATSAQNVSTRYLEQSDLTRSARLAIFNKISDDLRFYEWASRHSFPCEGASFKIG